MKNFNQPESKNLSSILLLSILTAGIFAGAVYSTKHDISSYMVHQYFIPEYSGNTIYEVFRNTFMSLVLFTATAFITGLSLFGQPAGILMLLYRGFGIGTAVSSVYLSKGLHGVPEVLILMFPECLITAVISFLAVREQMRLSKNILMTVVAEKPRTDKTFALYCLEFIVLVAVSFVVAVLASAMNYIFSGLR